MSLLLDISDKPLDYSQTVESLKYLHKYANKIIDAVNQSLLAIDEGNITDSFKDFLKSLQGAVVITSAVITESIYADYGDIAELTVDRLSTNLKVDRYKNSDTSDINYILIEDQTASWITGTVKAGPIVVQHTNRSGQLLYWKDETQLVMGTEATTWPVYVYDYDELTKLQITFDLVNGVYIPRITLGAGVGNELHPEWGKAFIYKTSDKLIIEHYTDLGVRSQIEMTGYVDAKLRRLYTCEINKTAGTVTVRAEGETSSTSIGYTETATSMTFTWPDNFTTTVSIN